jgi:hypothetical protein
MKNAQKTFKTHQTHAQKENINMFGPFLVLHTYTPAYLYSCILIFLHTYTPALEYSCILVLLHT